MSVYPIVEIGLIALIGAVSLYHVIKALMPRVLHGGRASIALGLSRGVGVTSWRHKLAVKVRESAPQSACVAGCGRGCNGCSVAVQVRKPAPAGDQTLR